MSIKRRVSTLERRQGLDEDSDRVETIVIRFHSQQDDEGVKVWEMPLGAEPDRYFLEPAGGERQEITKEEFIAHREVTL